MFDIRLRLIMSDVPDASGKSVYDHLNGAQAGVKHDALPCIFPWVGRSAGGCSLSHRPTVRQERHRGRHHGTARPQSVRGVPSQTPAHPRPSGPGRPHTDRARPPCAPAMAGLRDGAVKDAPPHRTGASGCPYHRAAVLLRLDGLVGFTSALLWAVPEQSAASFALGQRLKRPEDFALRRSRPRERRRAGRCRGGRCAEASSHGPRVPQGHAVAHRAPASEMAPTVTARAAAVGSSFGATIWGGARRPAL